MKKTNCADHPIVRASADEYPCSSNPEYSAPLITPAGTRIPGLRFGDPRAYALLQALLVHRLLPRGFTNRELRTLIAPLLGKTPEDITAGKMTYDLRRLREHGLIARIPHTRRYQVTDTGLHQALLFTRAHEHLLRPGLAQTTDPSPPAASPLRAAARAYQAAYDDLARQAWSTPSLVETRFSPDAFVWVTVVFHGTVA
jgi:hypothetical protein